MLNKIERKRLSCSGTRGYIFIVVQILILLISSLILVESHAFDRTVWSSQDLGLRFSYDNTKWTEATPIQDSTVVCINWLCKKSGGLLATCYFGVFKSGFGKLPADAIHGEANNVAKSIKENELKRCIEYSQLALERKYSDNHPVIYLSRSIKTRGFDGDEYFNIYSIITAWKNREIVFSCSSDIPIRFPQYKDEVEKQMMNVLKTLQFDR